MHTYNKYITVHSVQCNTQWLTFYELHIINDVYRF